MIRIVHFGLGPIGSAIARQVAARRGLKIAGGIDIDPLKTGRDVGDVIGLGRKLGVVVCSDAKRALRSARPDIVILCTSSSLRAVMPQLQTILEARLPVVSTTEELSYPGYAHMSLARQIHRLAKKARVAVLGTGVNPGFVMDALPITLTGVCERVDSVTVERVQDARIRRLPFQQKIGAGLTRQAFEERVRAGSVRHVGLTESIAMIADALGWRLERVTDIVAPRIARERIASDLLTVAAGHVCGIVQDGVGYRDGKAVITLHMEAYLGALESYDSIVIEGSPRLAMKIPGGVHGDVATASIVVNSIPKVLAAAPGLHTMRDLPLPSYFAGRTSSRR